MAFARLSSGLLNHSFNFIVLICLMQQISFAIASRAHFVTCGTMLKLMNVDLRLRLHSHDVKYGTGSGQQSVTGTEIQEDANSHWVVKPELGHQCTRGEPIKCRSIIRLQHLSTNRNLHSHHFTSPLSSNQEISCYGDDSGDGDTGDNWEVVCNNDFWRRDSPVKFKHIDTGVFLAGSGRTFGRPISGQGEIVGVNSQQSSYTDWIAKEGFFVHTSDVAVNHATHHTEL